MQITKWIEKREVPVQEYKKHRQRVAANITPDGLFKTLVRNTAYVFANGTCVARHDKGAPFYEVEKPDELFQVPKGRNASPYMNIQFADGQVIPIGIEICREHIVGVLQRYCAVNKIERPLIHFVLSDSCGAHTEKMAGDYFTHVDTAEKLPFARVGDSTHSDANVSCFRVNMLVSRHDLVWVDEVHISRASVKMAR